MTDRPPAPQVPATTPQMPVATTASQLGSDEIQAAMIAAGLVRPPTGESGDFNRVRIDGQTFVFGDPKNPEFRFDSPSDGRPAFRAQIARDAIEYKARFFDDKLAQIAERPNIANKMCKTHDAIPTQAGKRAEDGFPCEKCPVSWMLPKDSPIPQDGNGIAKKCSGMLDVEFRLLNEAGDGYIDDRIWTLSLSVTGLMEWQGSFNDRAAGYVTETSFKRKLAILAAQRNPQDIAGAVLRATQSLENGGVFAEARIIRAERNGNRFSVPSWTPYDIVEIATAPAITTEEQPAPEGVEQSDNDIPF